MIEKLKRPVKIGGTTFREKINELVDAVNELQHDNSEKANCQGSVLTMVDNQVTANLPNIDLGELAFLSKENTELKDEIDRLETELDRTRKALDVALCSLQDIAESDGDFITGSSTTLDAHEYAEMMLDKIKTALEQKDVK